MNTNRIQWHPGFYGGIELEFRDYKDSLKYETEYELSKKPLRVDMIIIRKDESCIIKKQIGQIFRKYNIIEYKGPNDEMGIDVFFKVIGYMGVYISRGHETEKISPSEVTISLFRHNSPEKLFSDLKNLGGIIENPFPGIYYVSGVISIPIQIVVIKELLPEENIPLRVLTPSASIEDARRFVKETQKYTSAYDKHNADAVLQVSVSANRDIYETLREEFFMCEALRDLMKDEIEKDVNAGIEFGKREGKIEGRREGIISTLYDLIKKGLISIEDAATQAQMSVPAFTAEMKKLG